MRVASSWLASSQSKQCSNRGLERLIWPWKTCYIFLSKLTFKSKPHSFFKNRTKMFQHPLLSRLALSYKQFCHVFCSFFPPLPCAVESSNNLGWRRPQNRMVQPIKQSLTRSKERGCYVETENELFTKFSLLIIGFFLREPKCSL